MQRFHLVGAALVLAACGSPPEASLDVRAAEQAIGTCEAPEPDWIECYATQCLPNGTWTYVPAGTGVDCSNAGHCDGAGHCQVTWVPPPPPTDPAPHWPPQTEVRITATTSAAAFVQALGEGGHRIVLEPDVDLDLTGFEGIAIAANTTITGNGARHGFDPGPRLFVRVSPRTLFNLRGDLEPAADHIVFEGFRIHGAHFEPVDLLSTAIQILSSRDVEIADMEIAGWPLAGVQVRDDAPLDRNQSTHEVRIHDSYIHHNQHSPGGNGYGVETQAGAYAEIERTVFDFNRHAIASSGLPGTGYNARHNLVLKGGGLHCLTEVGDTDLFCGRTHAFDVHGAFNDGCYESEGAVVCGCFPRELVDNHQLKCGGAGDRFSITDNAFQYTADHAFDLRGTPARGAFLYRNVFAHPSEGAAVHQYESGLVLGSGPDANRAGIETFGQYGVGDFDGDGLDDLFLATGVSWWYASAGRGPWTFLKTATERLASVRLGDLDGDGRCDVIAGRPLQIASAGRGAWQPLPGSNDVPIAEIRVGHFDGGTRHDLFRRDPAGRWLVSAPGIHDWNEVGSSSYPLAALRFGNFNADAVTDVIVARDGGWSVSWSARTPWAPLGSINSDFANTTIGDVDNDGLDDVVRVRVQTSVPNNSFYNQGTHWEVSWGGRSTSWQHLLYSPVQQYASLRPPSYVAWGLAFFGKFWMGTPSALLSIDDARRGVRFDAVRRMFVAHGNHNY
jgi:hypothetical protein